MKYDQCVRCGGSGHNSANCKRFPLNNFFTQLIESIPRLEPIPKITDSGHQN